MSDRLPVPYERNLRRLVRALTSGTRGGLFICVGRSSEVRSRVETELVARLGAGYAVKPVSLETAADEPWRRVVAAHEDSDHSFDKVVLSVALGGGGPTETDEKRDAELLLRLNVGREIRVQKRMRLLLWIEGLVQLDRLRVQAPDLWSFRLDELFFLSRVDFESAWQPSEAPASHDENISQIDERLKSKLLGIGERIDLLTYKAGLLTNLSRADESVRVIDSARELLRYSRLDDTSREVLRSNIFSELLSALRHTGYIHTGVERARQIERESKGARRSLIHMASRDTLSDLLVLAGDFRGAIESCDLAIADVTEGVNAEFPVSCHGAAFFINRAEAWMRVGLADRSVVDSREAESRASRSTSQRERTQYVQVRLSAMSNLARYHILHARPIEALLELSQTLEIARAAHSWNGIDGTFWGAATIYLNMGVVGEAEALATAAIVFCEAREELDRRASWIEWIADMKERLGLDEQAMEMRRKASQTWAQRWNRSDASSKSIEAGIALARFHSTSTSDSSLERPSNNSHELATGILTDALKLARRTHHRDLEIKCHEALGETYGGQRHFDNAVRHLRMALKLSEPYKGSSALAGLWIDLALVEQARGDFATALAHFDRARVLCDRDGALYRSRFVWKRLMVERHRTEVAMGDLIAARASLEDALTVLRAECLRLEEMEVLHHLAELSPAPDADDHREAAAIAALEIARDAMYPSDEARAMLTLVELGIAAGRRDAVVGQFREAAWIARELGPRELRRRADWLAPGFEQSPVS